MTNQNALIMCINVSIFEQKLAFLNNILSSTNNAEPKKKTKKKQCNPMSVSGEGEMYTELTHLSPNRPSDDKRCFSK